MAQPVVKGDYVAIRSTTLAEPLILALYEAVLRRGGHPFVWVDLPQIDELFLDLATEEQLDYLDPLELELVQRIDKRFRIVAPFNTRALSQIAATRLQRSHAAYRPLIECFWERSANGSLAWNVCTWPTQASAQEAGMGLRAYSEFVYRAYGLDQVDPVGYWCALRERQQKLVEWLNGKMRLEVRGHWVSNGEEGASFWLSVITDLRNRGVEDIFIACVDGLQGFKEAIQSVFPRVALQRCVIHQIRHSLKYVVWKERKAFARDLKAVYQAPTRQAAETALLKLAETWGEKYAIAVRSWENNWEDLATMFDYTPEIRRLIYTTNLIEG